MSELNQRIREFREDIGQSIEGLALLMKMEPEEFARLEVDWIPPDEILQRLCSLFEWNYKDIKRLAQNTPNSKPKEKNHGNKQQVNVEGKSDEIAPTPLAGMVRESRNNAGQDAKGISTLLGVSLDYYEEIESGLVPPDNIIRKLCSLYGWNYKQIQQKIKTQSTHILGTRQPPLPASEIKARLTKVEIPDIDEISSGVSLKKKISTLYGWNYHEILNREKSAQLSKLQPTVTILESSNSSINELKLRETQAEISENWKNISKENQQTLLTQLEFIRDSMKNLEVE